MDCFCGCGAKLPGKLTSVNIEAANVAIELLAWDKARSTSPQVSPVTPETERLIARGVECFQRLLATLHDEQGPDPLPDSEEWLDESFQARRDRPEMTSKGSILHRPRLTLTDPDYARLDRKRPERSFSGHTPPAERRAGANPAEQLEHLTELHATGALTEDEFAAAKARVLGRLPS